MIVLLLAILGYLHPENAHIVSEKTGTTLQSTLTTPADTCLIELYKVVTFDLPMKVLQEYPIEHFLVFSEISIEANKKTVDTYAQKGTNEQHSILADKMSELLRASFKKGQLGCLTDRTILIMSMTNAHLVKGKKLSETEITQLKQPYERQGYRVYVIEILHYPSTH